MNWGIVFRSLPTYAEAALLTVRVALFGIAGALLVGMCCAVAQHFRLPVARQVAAAYIEISRNTPLLVQLFFLYYGLPKLGVAAVSWPRPCAAGLTRWNRSSCSHPSAWD